MKLKRTKHFNSLCVNLDSKPELVERIVLLEFNKIGIVKDNYLDHEIYECLHQLLKCYVVGIIINENYRNELIDNVSNLELIN